MDRLYLDHAATTPLCEPAREAIVQWLAEYGNPSSIHAEGRRARAALDQAREVMASHLGCLFGEAHFTSSGTESCNLAILGCCRAALDRGLPRPRVLVGASEHHAILHLEPLLAALGFRLEIVPVDPYGRVLLDALSSMLDDQVLMVSVMTANNELGTFAPVTEAAELAHAVGAFFHTDAVQTFGLDARSVDDLGCDLLSAAGHKLYGPKGAGLLYVRSGTPILPITVGGGQERELRAGTENVGAIVGFAAALQWIRKQEITSGAREAFFAHLDGSWARTIPPEVPTLPGHAHVRFPGVPADTLLIKLDRLGISASSGAACSSGSIEPSHVLLACGFSDTAAKEALRFSFGLHQGPNEGRQAAMVVSSALLQ